MMFRNSRLFSIFLFSMLLCCCLLFVSWWKAESKALFLSGLVAQHQGNIDDALLYFEKAGALPLFFQTSREALFYEGLLRYQQGQCEEAVVAFHALRGYSPDSVIEYALGRSLECTGRDDAALSHFLGLQNDAQFGASALEEIAMIYYRRDDLLEAEQWFHRAVSDYTNVVSSHAMYRYALFLLHDRPFDALQFLGEIAEKNEQSESSKNAAIIQGRLRALSTFSADEAYYDIVMAQALNSVFEPAFALRFIDDALLLRPDYRDAYIIRAQSFALLGEARSMQEDIAKVLELDPEEAKSFERLIIGQE